MKGYWFTDPIKRFNDMQKKISNSMKEIDECSASARSSQDDDDLFKKIHEDLLTRAKIKAAFEGSNEIVINMSHGIWLSLKARVSS